MNRRYAILNAVGRAIGTEAATEEQIFGALDGIFTPAFLDQNATEQEVNRIVAVLQSPPWVAELCGMLGVERD